MNCSFSSKSIICPMAGGTGALPCQLRPSSSTIQSMHLGPSTAISYMSFMSPEKFWTLSRYSTTFSGL